MKLVICLLAVLIILIVDSLNGQRPDANVKSGQLDETSVLRMGRQFGNPLLRLLGTAMRNSKMEVLGKICSLNKCGEWSEWSSCTVVTNERFGMTTRSRECGKGPSFCKSNGSQVISIEMDSEVCMNCPTGFTKTNNKFCFLLHTTKMTRDDAGRFCEGKGSFVVNPNSRIKSDDLHDLLRSRGKSTSSIWLNRRRKDVVSSWEYSYGTGTNNYSNWKPGQPNQLKNEFCSFEDSSRKWLDVTCTGKYIFVCEFP